MISKKRDVCWSKQNISEILKSMGVNGVYVAPEWAMMSDGRKFSWQRPFTDKREAEKARIKFLNGI